MDHKVLWNWPLVSEVTTLHTLPHTTPQKVVFHLKMGQSRPLFILYSVFSNKQYNFNNKSMLKMSCPSMIRCRNLNPQPVKHESSPITTRPGHYPKSFSLIPSTSSSDVRLTTTNDALTWTWNRNLSSNPIWIVIGNWKIVTRWRYIPPFGMLRLGSKLQNYLYLYRHW